MSSKPVSIDELPSELRSRAQAAAGNASFLAVSANEEVFTVYAISGDTFVRMRLTLREDHSVSEETQVWPMAEVSPRLSDGELGSMVVGDHHTALVVPATVVDAVRAAQGSR